MRASLGHPDLKEGVGVVRRTPATAVRALDRRNAMTNYETIRYEQRRPGRQAHAQPARPDERDDQPDGAETTQALERPLTTTEVRILVLTGAGKQFCPGADLQGVTSARAPT